MMHSVEFYVMPPYNVTLQKIYIKIGHIYKIWLVQHPENFIYSARYSAILRRKVKAPYSATVSRY